MMASFSRKTGVRGPLAHSKLMRMMKRGPTSVAAHTSLQSVYVLLFFCLRYKALYLGLAYKEGQSKLDPRVQLYVQPKAARKASACP